MEERLVETKQLDNMIELEIYDQSRQVAGDRWRVTLVVKARVPVEKRFFKDEGQDSPDIADMQNVLGDHVTFEQRRERNFVDENEKDEMWRAIYDQFAESTLGYIAHPDFPMKLILREYKEYLAKRGRCGKL
ncbi:MAG: hypothetical protein SWH61_03030 [Thermodesulfobacteriota bacterium]|nr:hypothetical protein [Thermodesulfobacteriota bacterium]